MKILSGHHLFVLAALLPLAFSVAAEEERNSISTTAGADVAQTLTALYSNTVENCGTDSKPAFLCSGVTLRATETSASFYPWNPSPGSVTRGGVAFSWLRKDSNFSRLVYGYGNGFIFYPVLSKPSDKLKIEILCFFPLDSDSLSRGSPGGCGAHNSYPSSSGLCHELTPKVDTAAGWFSHYTSIADVNYERHHHQCGFDIRDKMNYHAGPNFTTGVKARALLTGRDQTFLNEMLLATWAQNIPKQLPIMAFFYINDSSKAKWLADARNDQQRFYQQTGGQIAPIIQITLPSTASGTATFIYYDDEQWIK